MNELIRKVYKLGKSLVVTIPSDFVQRLGLEADSNVRLELNIEQKCINIFIDTKREIYPDIFVKYKNGRYSLWNGLITQETDLNKLLSYKEKIQLKSQIKVLNGKKYFVTEL